MKYAAINNLGNQSTIVGLSFNLPACHPNVCVPHRFIMELSYPLKFIILSIQTRLLFLYPFTYTEPQFDTTTYPMTTYLLSKDELNGFELFKFNSFPSQNPLHGFSDIQRRWFQTTAKGSMFTTLCDATLNIKRVWFSSCVIKKNEKEIHPTKPYILSKYPLCPLCTLW
jgi:hypothetical protein